MLLAGCQLPAPPDMPEPQGVAEGILHVDRLNLKERLIFGKMSLSKSAKGCSS